MSGQDAEDTITDVDGSDCCNTFTPSDDLAVLYIVLKNDSHFHLSSFLICNPHFLSLNLTVRKGQHTQVGGDGSRS